MFKVKKEILGILKLITPFIKEDKLYQSIRVPVFLPFYHLVTNQQVPHIKHIYEPKSVQLFEEELDYILAHFQPIGMNEVVRKNKNDDWNRKGKPFVHFSFDDGLFEIYDVIAPILKKKGVPATFFINPAFLGDQDVFYRYRVSMLLEEIEERRVDKAQENTLIGLLKDKGLFNDTVKKSLLNLNYSHKDLIKDVCKTMLYNGDDERRIYMTNEEVKSLIAEGFTIGAHSIDHPMYSELSMEEQQQQTRESIDEVVRLFELEHRLFAFPFTDHGVSPEFFDWMHDKDQPIADLSFGTAGLKKGILPGHYQRVPMELYTSSPRKRIMAEYMYRIILQVSGKQ